mmetsp:Transcript_46974/g.93535  ORF Transcript_46974/g.93535 Transcript_46974/m.93535 type:complete len:223 (-) Transcript_46974:1270-1938(-)
MIVSEHMRQLQQVPETCAVLSFVKQQRNPGAAVLKLLLTKSRQAYQLIAINLPIELWKVGLEKAAVPANRKYWVIASDLLEGTAYENQWTIHGTGVRHYICYSTKAVGSINLPQQCWRTSLLLQLAIHILHHCPFASEMACCATANLRCEMAAFPEVTDLTAQCLYTLEERLVQSSRHGHTARKPQLPFEYRLTQSLQYPSAVMIPVWPHQLVKHLQLSWCK